MDTMTNITTQQAERPQRTDPPCILCSQPMAQHTEFEYDLCAETLAWLEDGDRS